MAFSTMLRSPVAVEKAWSSAAPTARWLAVWPPSEKPFPPSDRVSSTLLAS